MSATVYLEGGGNDSKDLRIRCRQGFRDLLKRCGFAGKMPKLVACGGRDGALDDFKTAHEETGPHEYVAMLIDSEEPVKDIEKTWAHLVNRDGWKKPKGAQDDQVLLMTTCMETWIITDHLSLVAHYGAKLQMSALPLLNAMEARDRRTIQESLTRATKNCANTYAKGKQSFDILGKLEPDTLKKHLPSFVRVFRILSEKL